MKRPTLLLAVVLVVIALVTFVPIAKGTHIPGIYLGGERQFQIISAYSGVVAKIAVKEGDSVRAGEVIVEIASPSDDQLYEGLRKTESVLVSRLSISEDRLRRAENLIADNNISRLQYIEFQSAVYSARQELQQIRNNLDEIQSRRLNYGKIVSPRDGQVNNLVIHRGQFIASGQKALDIVASDSDPLFEIYVRPESISGLSINERVEVRFLSVSRNEAPLLIGKLVSLSASPIKADGSLSSKNFEGMYRGTVRVPVNEMEKMGRFLLPQGLPIEAIASTGRETILEYITTPFRQLFERAFSER